jgi:hypothetical protein
MGSKYQYSKKERQENPDREDKSDGQTKRRIGTELGSMAGKIYFGEATGGNL